MKGLSNLNHTYVPLDRGGEIFVLDTGAIITPESEAMLQALHSRSVGGFKSHLQTLAEKGPKNFMQNFYVGYGHKSIGDCGSTTVFIEGVSMLAAKAIQDNPLYSGQEASTRYIDFSSQTFIDPQNPLNANVARTSEGNRILEMQRKFYLDAQDPTRVSLRWEYSQGEEEKEEVYEKAINARAFDITRSLLPAGAATNLAWHTNLRQAADKILFLRHHPLPEIREISEGLEEALRKHHPNSFGHKRYPKTEEYQDLIAEEYFYHNPKSPSEPILDFGKIGLGELEQNRYLFDKRPARTDLPKRLAQIGTIMAQFRLDFGSFRDIQRHRALIQRMPLITPDFGFNQWYTENLPKEVIGQLPEHLKQINQGIEALNLSPEEKQYFLPMGYNTSNKFTGDLPALVYMLELRAKSDVHPSLQHVAYNIQRQITNKLGIPIYVGTDPGRFSMKRGEQDITLR